MPAKYAVEIKRSAEKDLDALPERTRSRIAKRLLNLENKPRPQGVVKLQGQDAFACAWEIIEPCSRSMTSERSSSFMRSAIDVMSIGDDRKHALHKQLAKAKSPPTRATQEHQIAAADRQIDRLVYDLQV